MISGTPPVSSVKHMPIKYKVHSSHKLSNKCIDNSPKKIHTAMSDGDDT